MRMKMPKHLARTSMQSSSNMSSLRGLFPFIKTYKGLIFAASIALIFTAALSLILPMAVRRVVDNFLMDDARIMDAHFGAALVISGLLAIGTALRYLIVTRLGERVVVDIRKVVFSRMIRMSPEFFENILTV